MDEARAFWVAAPGRGEIRAQRLRSLVAGELLVRARASAISRGTETLVFRGEVPQSEWQRMRCPFQEGEFPAPVKYGYAVAGIVEDGSAELCGRRVFCLHPHQDRFIVPQDAALAIPDDVPDRRATFAGNMETAINGLWDGGTGPGELIDIDLGRAELARALGCRFAAPHQARGEADLVIHASGKPDGLATALAIAGFEATVLEMSWYGTRVVPLALGGAFHSRRLSLRSSQVGSVPPDRRARWSRRRRLALALSLLRDPVFDLLLSGETDFFALPELMARLATSSAGGLCHTVRYD